jgi:hypothetical protein
MFALGCVQSQSCHTDRCPTGVTTQNALRQRALVVPDKAERVFRFHRNTLEALGELVGAAGLEHPRDLKPMHILKRAGPGAIMRFDEAYHFLKTDELLAGSSNASYARLWGMANSASFDAELVIPTA